MNIFLVAPFEDSQSGTYIHDSLVQLGHKVAFYDWKQIITKKGVKAMNDELINAITQLKKKDNGPDLTIIIKGTGFEGETIKKIKEIHQHPVVGWIFDVTLSGTMIKDVPQYVSFIKELDIFYTIDNDALPELKKLGVNAQWLSEGCYEPDHKEVPFNFIQKKKYGASVVFLGSVGSIHKNRAEVLKAIYDEGIPLKLYGAVLYPENEEPDWVKDTHTGFLAINDYHSLVCGASDIIIGIDGWPERNKAYSARLYRTLCAGGFLLTTATKGLDENFVPGQHIDVYSDTNELIEKIMFYLSNEERREIVAKAGKELVLEKHQFIHRLQEIIDDVN